MFRLRKEAVEGIRSKAAFPLTVEKRIRKMVAV